METLICEKYGLLLENHAVGITYNYYDFGPFIHLSIYLFVFFCWDELMRVLDNFIPYFLALYTLFLRALI